jgi:hypothetical protein
MKKWPSDLVLITLVKMVLNRRLIGASLPLFEPTRLSLKKVPQWSLLLCFFRLSKYEKPPSLPSLGSLNLHRRTLPLCVLSTAFAYLIRQPCNSLLLRLNTFGLRRIFPEYHSTRTSVLSLCLELVCLQHSFLLCNVIFLYSFSTIIEKNKKIKYTPKRGREKYFLYWQHNESPLDKAHLSICSSDYGM